MLVVVSIVDLDQEKPIGIILYPKGYNDLLIRVAKHLPCNVVISLEITILGIEPDIKQEYQFDTLYSVEFLRTKGIYTRAEMESLN